MDSYGSTPFLQGQVAIVTGAAQGNGFAIAERLSRHGCRIAAIDINAAHADYWLWRGSGERHRIPPEIVDIFERHGFIWGGKWLHYDTMHFEYRPELLNSWRSPVEPDILHAPAVENAVVH